MQASLRPAACLAAQGAGNMKNRQPFPGSVFRAVKKKKAASAKKYSGFGEKHAPSSKGGKKYNRCTCEKHVTLVRAVSRTEDKTGSKNVQLVLQSCCKTSSIAMLRVQTCLSTNQLVAGCGKLSQKVESSSTFCNKI